MNAYATRLEDAYVERWLPFGDGLEISRTVRDRAHELPSGDRLLARLTYRDALALATREGASLISIDQVTELHDRAEIEPPPITMPATRDMASLEWSEAHDSRLYQLTHGVAGLVANAGKHWVAGAPPGRAWLRGWWVPHVERYGATGRTGPGFVQECRGGQGPHDDLHHDYGTTTMLVRPRRASDGDDDEHVAGWADKVIAAGATAVERVRDGFSRLIADDPHDTDPAPAPVLSDADVTPIPDPLYRRHVVTPTTIAAVRDALERAWPGASRASIAVLCAQIVIETGLVHLHNWNLGNVKRVAGQPWTMLPHVWEIIGGQKVTFEPPHPQTHFRAFDSLDAGAAAYLEIMRKRYADAWPAVLAGDPRDFAHRLKLARYYTASEGDYARALESTFKALV